MRQLLIEDLKEIDAIHKRMSERLAYTLITIGASNVSTLAAAAGVNRHTIQRVVKNTNIKLDRSVWLKLISAFEKLGIE